MRLIQKLVFLAACIAFVVASGGDEKDLYKLLGVKKDATVKEIRKAFKSLAVKLHPDKNKEDADADAKFIKIAQAYETLKDPETRKTYDIYGDTGATKGQKSTYHSYSYYADEFGLYDDDPLIVTLSKADYEVNVLDASQGWFVNFYSPHCHHCHVLAPTWRKLAAELEGVVQIAAVNCEEDWVLCNQLQVHQFPTLLYYEKEAHMFEGARYAGAQELSALKKHVLSKLIVSEKKITASNWDELKNQRWLLLLCADDNVDCPEPESRLKLAATMEGLMPVGYITNPGLCNSIYKKHQANQVVYWHFDDKVGSKVHAIKGSDTKEIVDKVLDLLPNPELLNDDKFKKIRTDLRTNSVKPWLICFYMGTATDLNLQLKRLPALIPNINVGLIHCGKSSALCSSLHVSHYPTWGVLKEGGAFELHHGRDVLQEVAAFAKDSSKSTNLHALSPADFLNIRRGSEPWFIDWYAPWCPPCRKLMPEIRKVSQLFNPGVVQFGTVDCTLHSNLCAQEGIQSYPTTVFYNGSENKQHFHGMLNKEGISDFIEDMLYPLVITLDSSNFVKLMRKPEDEMWFVDYFAPWCGPCQRLAPKWRALAKQMSKFDNVKIASVDCVANSDLCNAQNVHNYPTLRLYPLGSKGLRTVAMYNGHRELLELKHWLMDFLPSNVVTLTGKAFKDNILNNKAPTPWLVDFYAPWCGHCIHFAPDFAMAAELLKDTVKSGKLDCQAEHHLCSRMLITGYPTVILYLSADNWHEIVTQVPQEIEENVKNLLESESRYIHDEF